MLTFEHSNIQTHKHLNIKTSNNMENENDPKYIISETDPWGGNMFFEIRINEDEGKSVRETLEKKIEAISHQNYSNVDYIGDREYAFTTNGKQYKVFRLFKKNRPTFAVLKRGVYELNYSAVCEISAKTIEDACTHYAETQSLKLKEILKLKIMKITNNSVVWFENGYIFY